MANRPVEEINTGFNDAEGVNNSPRSTYIYKDISLFFTRNPVTNDVSQVNSPRTLFFVTYGPFWAWSKVIGNCDSYVDLI